MAVEITGITTTPLSDVKNDSSTTTPGNTIASNSEDTKRPANTVISVSGNPNDSITLTKQAEELRMIEKAVNKDTGVDSERVENLKFEIDTGRYDIDSQRVAEKLIEFETLFVA